MPRKRKPVLLHERLRKRRAELRLSIDEVARKAGLTYATYMAIDSGKSSTPQLKNITRVARVLEISLDELVLDMYHESNE